MKIVKPSAFNTPAIIDIFRENMSPYFMPEMLNELDDVIFGRISGFIAVDDDNTLGYITVAKVNEVYKLETLAVSRHHHGNGVGRSLVEFVEDFLRQEVKEKPIVFNVVTDDSSDDPVSGFYEKCGFYISGIVKDEFRLGDRQIHLSKLLY